MSSEVVIVKGKGKMNTSSTSGVGIFKLYSSSKVNFELKVIVLANLSISFDILNESYLAAAEKIHFIFPQYHMFTEVLFIVLKCSIIYSFCHPTNLLHG